MFKKIAIGSFAVACGAVFLVASSVMCAMNAAHAQYAGPSQVKQYKNVAEILKDPVDDVYVTLKGKIPMQVSNKTYQFTDGTGTIDARIGPKEFAGQRIDANTQVEIWGEVDKDVMQKPKIDVKRLTVIQ